MDRYTGKVTAYLIDHHRLAKLCGTTTEALSRWVSSGLWPPPHSAFGRTKLYRVADVKHYLDTGSWPTTAFRIADGRGGTKGRDFRDQAEGDGKDDLGRGVTDD
jgi:hypothetical protein